MAAIGWAELGNLAESRAELAQLSPANRQHPDVLEVEWLVCAEAKDWDKALACARALVDAAPRRVTGWLHQAYALRRVSGGSIEQAWKKLLPAAEKFPNEPTVLFNLACYACQMKDLETARGWLRRALLVGNREQTLKMALSDPDLEPLWEEIRDM
jgi:Flp pilus assembly protein TadD